jgi:hypothetical protein
MTENDSENSSSPLLEVFGGALTSKPEDRPAELAKAAEDLRLEMEGLSDEACNLILRQPALDLLGYLWSRFFMDMTLASQGRSKDDGPDKEIIQKFQFAHEYAHAVWSAHAESESPPSALNEDDVKRLFEVLDKLSTTTMMFCMASSMASGNNEFGDSSSDVEFHAKSSWVLIRGHRYQVLEEEFFQFVLRPHDSALVQAYGVSADVIAAGIQAIVTSLIRGMWSAADVIEQKMNATYELAEAEGISLDEAMIKMKTVDPGFDAETGGAMQDLFFGGMCNLSRHTSLPPSFLEDLSFSRGGNTEFFAPGPLKGTPMRTLPARIRPLVRLGADYYAPDGQFVRDSAYRAIQRGLLARLPGYREEWKERQADLVELALPSILRSQFERAKVFKSVFFKDVDSRQWVETDLVVVLSDVLLVLEAKAGVGAMGSPETNFSGHARAVRDLVTKAYDQCSRFLKYLNSQRNAPIFRLEKGAYSEVARINLADFRLILPMGLTVESFTPFSSMCKELPGITPILGKHPFVSMSVDDLFVLNRFLPTAGELLHYLEVRQQVAGIPKAMLFDELDHLGAYISHNRFDQTLRDQLKKADMVTWDAFSDRVDRYFENDRWLKESPPAQEYPPKLREVLAAIDSSKSPHRLRFDAHLRNLSGTGREDFSRVVSQLIPTLTMHPLRRALFDRDDPLQVWVCQDSRWPPDMEVTRQGEIACLLTQQAEVLVLLLGVDSHGEVTNADCRVVRSPPMIRSDYFALREEAARQGAKAIAASAHRRKAKRDSRSRR